MPNSGVKIDSDMSPADEATVVHGLLSFNERWLGPANAEEVKLVARDDQGVVGGLIGQMRGAGCTSPSSGSMSVDAAAESALSS